MPDIVVGGCVITFRRIIFIGDTVQTTLNPTGRRGGTLEDGLPVHRLSLMAITNAGGANGCFSRSEASAQLPAELTLARSGLA